MLDEISNGSKSLWKYGSLTSTESSYYMNDNDIYSHNTYETDGRLISMEVSSSDYDYLSSEYDFSDQTGNLLSRTFTDIYSNILEETFDYDALDRLTSIDGELSSTIEYDDDDGVSLGNIVSKSDVGSFEYTLSQPNAISGFSTTYSDLLALPTQEITYTDFNKVETITEGVHSMSFEYGPSQTRKKVVYEKNSETEWTRYYAGNVELTEYADGDTKEVTYVNSPDGLTAVYIDKNGSGQWYFVLKDHLGSIMGLINEDNELVESYSYDAWGRRRNTDDWSYDDVADADLLDRGYTGHEHLDMFNLINMNGRVYDPLVGRFLSPDNYVQQPGNTQSYNRYAYCFNNPLVYTDPDGENPIGFIIGGIVGGFGGYATGQAMGASGWKLAGYTAVGAIAGAATFGISTYASTTSAAITTGAGASASSVTAVSGLMGAAVGGAAGGAGNAALSGSDGWGMLSGATYGAGYGTATAVATYGITAGLVAAGYAAGNNIMVNARAGGQENLFAAMCRRGIDGNLLRLAGENASGIASLTGANMSGLLLSDNPGVLTAGGRGGILDASNSGGNGITFGTSADVTLATPWIGYTYEGGDIGVGKDAKKFISHGKAYGLEASVGFNGFVIIPVKDSYSINDVEGTSYAFTGNYSFFSLSVSGNSSPGYPEDSFGDSYIVIKVGIGFGFGGSTSKTTTNFYTPPAGYDPLRATLKF